ncbi:MAG: exonuclease SbcCD subunit D [Nitrososphaerales archaeon]
MLIAHISDIHLGYSQFNLEEREEDVYDAFDQAINASVKEKVKIVILAGDLFHMPKPQGEAIVRFADALKKLKELNIKTFFVLGEHDISRTRGVPVPYVFHNLGYAYYLRNGEPYEIDGTLLIGFDKYRNSEMDDLSLRLKEADRRAKAFSGRRILVLHQGLFDFSRMAGEINSSDLPPNFNYYAMGHYHDRHERRFEHLGGPLAYPGSLEITSSESIRETDKGFYLVDTSRNEALLNWIKLEIRPQVAVQITYDHIRKQIEELVLKIKSLKKKPILSTKVKGQNIDSGVIAENLSKLNDLVLHHVWEPIEEKQVSLSVYHEKPSDMDSEMLNKSKEVLGSDELAEFAIQELLPLLAENKIDEACALAWKVYENSRFQGRGFNLQ